ncbi:MAG: DUF4399 domain-containing protein [Candidatus Thiodiazotropha taylori]|nr:DUF4399 domain-containing protein [Candidatus Thiodiazotropha taylori]MCG8096633.1 DUF4399 domain-containing protein [Candidatus Thiodiazotropha endolucinida]MCG7883426.1 DUF4399 domain-containing protein [Candidatus Thiodiazotropha taylori]MCG7888147.1 DUF4399 domain-containing protein [Candidatus Thiodiazotropha taylori]MCG7889691.1 DUF4399 domain-containing protein [Candidatus Thiodiazotropha taylori]
MKSKLHPFIGLILLLVSLTIIAHTPPPGARVFFIDIEDGAMVDSPFKVKFGIEGFGITPAGTKGKIRHQAGHHHLLINVDQLPDLDSPIPRDEHHLHFDNGETEAVLDLPPGIHTLQLLLGDEDHEPQDPVLMSEKITVKVK